MSSSSIVIRLFALIAVLQSSLLPLVLANNVQSISLYQTYNANQHHTNKYETVGSNSRSDLILRRGSMFFAAVRLTSAFDPKSHFIYLRFVFGQRPSPSDGSMAYFQAQLRLTDTVKQQVDTWSAEIYSINDRQVELNIYIPSTVPVGKWKINFSCRSSQSQTREVTVPNDVYILFNPWSSIDTVYMPNESDRKEYVLNEMGAVFVGSLSEPETREWYYEQFKISSLKASIFVLDRAGLSVRNRANPVMVAQTISKMVNSNDDNGVVVGKWTEPYKPGKAPWEWMGSGAILKQYLQSYGQSVKYAQCWVFAGLTTTISRALGIPARPVTNFGSAHDTDRSLTVDRFYDLRGNEVKGVNTDSVWNFHVWSEHWMSRPDLAIYAPKFANFDWQVIDSTPQEKSDYVYKMGPAPVTAAKFGEINLKYDLPFLYAEVNADLVTWQRDLHTGRWRKLSTNPASIGQLILTKGKGEVTQNFDNIIIEDITGNYKFMEGTKEERESMYAAGRHMNLKYIYDPNVMLRKGIPNDIELKFMIKKNQEFGDNLQVDYLINNRSPKNRTVRVNLSVRSVYYSGMDGSEILKKEEIFSFAPNEMKNYNFLLTPEQYLAKDVEFSMYKVQAFVMINETGQAFTDEATIKLAKPNMDLEIIPAASQSLSSPVTLRLTMKNPLINYTLTECKVIIKETELTEGKEIPLANIEPSSDFKYEFTVNPNKIGTGVQVAQLDCAQLYDVRARANFNII